MDVNEQLLDFLVNECTPDQLLYALAIQASAMQDEEDKLALAAHAYVLDRSLHKGRVRTPKGHGLRVFSDQFGVEINRLQKAVALVKQSQ